MKSRLVFLKFYFAFFLVATVVFPSFLSAQYDDMKVKNQEPIFPIWNKKVRELGHDIPLSSGIGANFFYQESNVIISDINIGFANGNTRNFDKNLIFNKSKVETWTCNFKADLWVFPFLNIYGIVSPGKTSTILEADVVVRDTSGKQSKLTSFSTTANLNMTTLGFGLIPTIGSEKIWAAINLSFTWSFMQGGTIPVKTFVFNPRVGTNIKFEKAPRMAMAIWAGAYMVNISSETKGFIPMSSLFNISAANNTVAQATGKVEQISQQNEDWWSSLSNLQKLNPINKAKYEATKEIADNAGDVLYNFGTALNNTQESQVSYNLSKRQAQPWNMCIGTQIQFNEHINTKLEAAFFGQRTQFLLGVEYRFNL